MSNYLMNPQKYADLPSSASKQLSKSVHSPGISFLQHGEQGVQEQLRNINEDQHGCIKIESESSDNVASNSQQSEDSEDTLGLCFACVCFWNIDNERCRKLNKTFLSIKSTWILLDTQSNCDVFKNRKFLHDIHHKACPGLIVKSNGDDNICTNQVETSWGMEKCGLMKIHSPIFYPLQMFAGSLRLQYQLVQMILVYF